MENNGFENMGSVTPELAKTPFSKKIENFWYHYKWHTIVTVFLLAVFAVCTFQMCSRTSYDVYIMYSGGTIISQSGDNSQQKNITDALKLVSSDFNKDGSNMPLFQAYLTPDAAEYKELGEGLDSRIQSDTQSFKNAMLGSSEFYLCFLSESNFKVYDKPTSSGVYPLLSISAFTSSNKSYEYASERGIYLRSLDFYKLPGINTLPEDTVICIRQRGVGGDDENFANAKTLLKNILSY